MRGATWNNRPVWLFMACMIVGRISGARRRCRPGSAEAEPPAPDAHRNQTRNHPSRSRLSQRGHRIAERGTTRG